MLKEETKKKLLEVAAELQIERKIRIDFDTAISFLIERYFNQDRDWEKFNVFCQTVNGVTTEELLGELKKGRKEDEEKYSLN